VGRGIGVSISVLYLCREWLRFRFGAGLPEFYELPVDVDGVVEVEDEAFGAIEEAQAEEVVFDESEDGIEQGLQ